MVDGKVFPITGAAGIPHKEDGASLDRADLGAQARRNIQAGTIFTILYAGEEYFPDQLFQLTEGQKELSGYLWAVTMAARWGMEMLSTLLS